MAARTGYARLVEVWRLPLQCHKMRYDAGARS